MAPISRLPMAKSAAGVCWRQRQDQETNSKHTKRNPMTSLRNFALQATVTLTLTSALGAVLFGLADYATRGVVIG